MSKWLSALGQGVAAVANVGSQAIDTQMKLDATIAAEQRAADLKLDTAERMMGIEEAMKNRAGDRFAKLYQQAAGEEVPVEAPTLEQTGLTRDSAVAPADGKPGADFAQSADDLAALEQQLKRAANNPDATDEQRQDARDALAALQAQKDKQKDVNAKSVEGQTRKRSGTEAARAAMETAAGTDFGAFAAGSSAWKDAFTREDQARDKATAAADKDADRASREKIAGMQVEQRATSSAAETARKSEADQLRYQAVQEKIQAIAGGKGEKATAMMKNYGFLEEKYGAEEAKKLLFTAKDSSDGEKLFKMMLADKFGDLTPEVAAAKLAEMRGALAPKPAAPAADAGQKERPSLSSFKR